MPGGRLTHWDSGEVWLFPVAAECSLREPQQVCDFLEESVVSVGALPGRDWVWTAQIQKEAPLAGALNTQAQEPVLAPCHSEAQWPLSLGARKV